MTPLASTQLTRSVRGRLALLVVVVLFPALLLTLVLTFQAYFHERNAVSEKLLSTARAVTGVVDSQIAESRLLLRTFATSDALLRGDLSLIEQAARRTLVGNDRWFVLTDPTGRQLINTRLPPGAALPSTAVDAELLAALNRGEEFVSNLRRGAAVSGHVVHVSRPLLVEDRLVYILNIGMLPSAISRAINVERLAPSSVVSVIDRNGIIITRNRNADRFVGGPATPDMVRVAAESAEGVGDSVTLEGIPVLTAHSRAQSGWAVLFGAPKAELYAGARRLLYLGVGCSALLAVAASLMAAWIGRAVVRGVDGLAADAEAVGRGQMPPAHPTGLEEIDSVARTMHRTGETLLKRTQTLELLNRVSAGLVAERDLEKIVQSVTDAGREVSGAAFGAFFYNVQDEKGESYMLYTLSGAPPEAFAKFGMPRNTAVFAPTFNGEGVVRVPDITADPRYGRMGPHHGMPKGHLPVRSYLAVPVKSRSGEVIGGLFFGHPQPDVFTREAEEVVVGLAGEAAIAIDNAKLYHAVARELEAKSKAEAELRAAQRDLERKVDERTASLREAVSQMEEFSYTVSHDLRSPLRAMNSYADALVEDYGPQLDATARGYIDRIRRASERMDRLTRDVLDYSRVSRTQVILAPTDIDGVVRSTIEHYGELQPGRADVHVSSPLGSVLAHEPSLRQCVANLLTNAAKFVRPGQRPRITVRSEPIDGHVRLWVEDDGIGIAPAYQDKLFRMFERAPTDTPFEGTGIGLAIVRRAVEKMGGTCGVVSDGTHGSRFWIELPAAG